MTTRRHWLLTALLPWLAASAAAEDGHRHGAHPASAHAPIGVMGDHLHARGEVMLSYRFMRMEMAGSRDGTDALAADEIVTSLPNRFFGLPGQPPTLRVVPEEMTMDMHMVGVMVGLSGRVTLTAMGAFVTNDMDHVTYRGPVGTDRLGGFETSTEGIGDTRLGALVALDRQGRWRTHAGLAVSLPTGSTTERGEILTPTGATPTVRLPYAMQLGSGTFDLLPSVTTLGRAGRFSWGAQASATVRLDENDEGYALGDRLSGTAWLARDLAPWLSGSLRAEAATQGRIEGRDGAIAGPVQTADPDNYGGETVTLALGANLIAPSGPLAGHRLAVEGGLPLYRDLNGPQLETDWTLTIGWQKAFGGSR